ncbi:hypothetical protein [Escherichia coli]|uniref:hypothetical protein n=1 Tax=Escherichia coli TaxID=562 RepID=UPI001C91A6F0
MLAERGVNVDHSTIYRWVQRYAPEMEKPFTLPEDIMKGELRPLNLNLNNELPP